MMRHRRCQMSHRRFLLSRRQTARRGRQQGQISRRCLLSRCNLKLRQLASFPDGLAPIHLTFMTSCPASRTKVCTMRCATPIARLCFSKSDR